MDDEEPTDEQVAALAGKTIDRVEYLHSHHSYQVVIYLVGGTILTFQATNDDDGVHLHIDEEETNG